VRNASDVQINLSGIFNLSTNPMSIGA
jgi:hypothetical protein